jgi:SAM-dependent methyltransferase
MDDSARTFDDLIAEADSVSVAGWDFSWLDGRATEERPPWGYQRLLGERLRGAQSALDIQTGGGEVLAGATDTYPPAMAATESWLPNQAKATALLHPRGVVVVATPDERTLPFADAAFDLVTSRHPATTPWGEISRVLRPGGTYFAQHVGPATSLELTEYFLGAWPSSGSDRHPDVETAEARAAGLDVVDLRAARLRMEFHDIGAVVYFLRKVLWTVPEFSVEKYLDRLRDMDAAIRRDGPFLAHSTRHLIEARKL